MILYFLNFRKCSTQVELDQFFKGIEDRQHSVQAITKSAFFQARKQLSHNVFIELNQIVTQGFYDQFNDYRKWNGFRLCAIDGSMIRLPNEPDIVHEFGTHTGKKNQADCSMGLTSVFYDVLNQIVIDSSINPIKASERDCAALHLEHARKNDLVIYDRGYNAFWLYATHTARDLAFCMRAKVNRGLEFKRFADSGKCQAVITLYPNKRSIEQCKEKGLPSTPIKLRLIRVDLPGEVEILITNLMDETAYDVDQFKSLYHLRWGIEENYKRLKQWVEIENFSGKSALSIKQDFYAKIVSTNLTALMAMAAQKQVRKHTHKYRLTYQVNFAQAVSKMKHTVVALIYHSVAGVTELVKQTINYIALTYEAVREGRTYERRLSTTKNKLHHCGYKRAL